MFTKRSATPTDLDLICRHRQEMFKEAGHPSDVLAALAEPFRAWLQPRLGDGRYTGVIIEEAGKAMGGIGMMVLDWPPHARHPQEAQRGYILNLYVEPTHRGRGLAHELMAAAEEYFRSLGVGFLILHATDMARPIYERAGWKAGTEMMKPLRKS